MSKVVIITTGGTIAMQHDSVTGAAVPAVSGADLVRAIPGLGSVCDLEVREFDNLPSPAITPDHMFRLAAMVRQYLAMDDVSGVVITHGTDSLEESAYFLDLSLEGHKPVCFTAAMRSGDELSPDGPRNILAAVRVAASRSARNMGSLVVMNEQIHAAREVTKTHAANVATFQSPWWGPLGVVDGDRVIFRRAQLGRQTFLPHSLCKKVDLIKLVTGSDAAYLDFAVSRGVDGIVVESFGRGNVPPYVIPGIARALEKGIIVVNATRTGGRVLDEYGYEGGMLQQHKMGVIMAGELSAAKAPTAVPTLRKWPVTSNTACDPAAGSPLFHRSCPKAGTPPAFFRFHATCPGRMHRPGIRLHSPGPGAILAKYPVAAICPVPEVSQGLLSCAAPLPEHSPYGGNICVAC